MVGLGTEYRVVEEDEDKGRMRCPDDDIVDKRLEVLCRST